MDHKNDWDDARVIDLLDRMREANEPRVAEALRRCDQVPQATVDTPMDRADAGTHAELRQLPPVELPERIGRFEVQVKNAAFRPTKVRVASLKTLGGEMRLQELPNGSTDFSALA